jgi:hypothetical protein
MKEPENRLFLSLQVPDLKAFPIWESIIEQEGDVSVFPVKDLPVSSLIGRVVGTQVTLGNGNPAWAIIMNLDTTDARKNCHLAQLEIERDRNGFFSTVTGMWTTQGTDLTRWQNFWECKSTRSFQLLTTFDNSLKEIRQLSSEQ